MPNRLARRTRRIADRLAGPYVTGLAQHLASIQQSVLDLHRRLGEVDGRLDRLEAELGAARAGQSAELRQLADSAAGLGGELGAIAATGDTNRQMLREVYEKADEQRLRLYALRDSEAYEAAFTEEEPLVSFVIPTYDRHELLRDVAIPSVLAQTYANLEVIVSGDGSPEDTRRAVEGFGDPRLRFINRTVRGPYPEDPERRWFMSGTPPLNDGVATARGRWIAILGDDDEVLPDHVERLLAGARERRLDCCYGRLKIEFGDGSAAELGTFPPQLGQFGLQMALYHQGLRFFQFEPSDVLYAEPNDWSLARRMLAAGVRFGMIDGVVAVKHERRFASRDAWPGEAAPD